MDGGPCKGLRGKTAHVVSLCRRRLLSYACFRFDASTVNCFTIEWMASARVLMLEMVGVRRASSCSGARLRGEHHTP